MELAPYLDRIGLDHAPPSDAAGLARLQSAHRLAIGFENLDVMLARPIRIDSASVFEKLVVRGRGGYCFEHNRLYADALTALGFAVRPLLARVRLAIPESVTPPRTHICLLVGLADGTHVLADAGFGGSNVPPLPLVDGAEATTGDGARHRLVRHGRAGRLSGEWLLERAGPAAATDGRSAETPEFQPQYTFDLAEVAPDDLEQANHWTSTRPGTRFTTLHVAAIPTADGFASLTDRTFRRYGLDGTQERTIDDPADYARLLAEVFRIRLQAEDAARLPLFAPTSRAGGA